jgi:hypothetical protein
VAEARLAADTEIPEVVAELLRLRRLSFGHRTQKARTAKKTIGHAREDAFASTQACRTCHGKTSSGIERSMNAYLVRNGSEAAPLCTDFHRPNKSSCEAICMTVAPGTRSDQMESTHELVAHPRGAKCVVQKMVLPLTSLSCPQVAHRLPNSYGSGGRGILRLRKG